MAARATFRQKYHAHMSPQRVNQATNPPYAPITSNYAYDCVLTNTGEQYGVRALLRLLSAVKFRAGTDRWNVHS